MKKNITIKTVLITFILLISGIGVVTSQNMRTYTWDSYLMTFEIPEDFDVKKSDGNNFSAGNGDIYLSIYPRVDENLSYEEMEEALIKWAKGSDFIVADNGVMYLDDLNGYWGVMADGVVDNWPVFIMLIIDPDYTNTSFYVWLSYREDKIETAEKILNSFIPN